MPALLPTMAAAALAFPAPAQRPADAPLFKVRARVARFGGKAPLAFKGALSLSGNNKPAPLKAGEWSPWLVFGPDQRKAVLAGYPAIYLRGYPVVTALSFHPVVDPTEVEAELVFDEGGTFKLSEELFGPRLGVLVWREGGKPRAATMAEYNRRYWKALEGVKITKEQRPKHFPIVDRFIGGDDGRRDWREGIEQLSRAGFSAIMLPPGKVQRELLLAAGHRRTSWAVYSPPGYAFDFDGKHDLNAWAAKLARPYLDAGYGRRDLAVFAMSDEPGWYYPSVMQQLEKSPAGLARFRDYLKARKLGPADVGAKSWDEVRPIGRGKATTLPTRRLFYWTARFFAHESSRHFAASTKALEKAFVPGMPVFTNWNFFAGRLYVPGPVANNPDKKSPDAAMGGHDWLEFGRMRGGTMLWTEDWFGDQKAYQWSYYAARLRSAARLGGVEFGGYVIPRTAGAREAGITQKILAIVGHGGKAIKYFVFGPEYNFPGNCYSERARVLPQMAEAHRLIGAAEEVLWPGRMPRAEVAIVMPRSAQLWDAPGISDATNHDLNRATVDYLAEAFDLYLALQHANVPVDFVDEDDLTAEGLKPYRAVYLTAPNVPAEGQAGLVAWVKSGGHLITVSNAAQYDRYDEPSDVLTKGLGLKMKRRKRLPITTAAMLKPAAKAGELVAFGVFDGEEGKLAPLTATVGKGRATHFPWLPGLSYWRSQKGTKDGLPAGFSGPLRRLIVAPALAAGARPPVVAGRAMVETPMLLSEKGAAVTLLNWSGEKLEALSLEVRLPFAPASVRGVYSGALKFEWTKEGVKLALPLDKVDVLVITPKKK